MNDFANPVITLYEVPELLGSF